MATSSAMIVIKRWLFKTEKVFWVRVSYIADPELIYVQPLDVVGYEGKLVFLKIISKIIRITIFLYM